jgi:hypothetical protein
MNLIGQYWAILGKCWSEEKQMASWSEYIMNLMASICKDTEDFKEHDIHDSWSSHQEG